MFQLCVQGQTARI